jgi:hypothetical protein
MSTPSGKPLNPNLSVHVPDDAREWTVTERHSSEDGNDPLRSPYAPKQAHKRAGTDWHPVETDRDPLRSPYAPPKVRAQPAVTTEFAAGDAGPLPPVRAGRLRDHTEPHGVGADEAHLRSHDAVGGQHAPERSLSNGPSGRDEQAAQRHVESINDRDLERLEASLRWLQRQETATRLPRATHLAPVVGLAPVDTNSRQDSGLWAGEGFRSPRSLEPERLPPPPAMPRRNILAPLAILVASILVAPIVYYLAVGGWAPPSEPAPEPQTASVDPTVVAPPSWFTGQQAPWPTMAQDADPATSAQGDSRTKTSQPARSPEGETVSMLQPDEPGAQAPTASKATRVLDPEEIKLLMKQGEQFIAAGDVVTARIVFRRAAEAGDAGAAVALGVTYDPIVLAKLGVVGLGADVEKARIWYQKAESLGSAEATRRLATLADR